MSGGRFSVTVTTTLVPVVDSRECSGLRLGFRVRVGRSPKLVHRVTGDRYYMTVTIALILSWIPGNDPVLG